MRKLDIIDRLLIKCGNQAAAGRALGAENRSTSNPWFKKRRIPSGYWPRVTELLPGVSIEDCYMEFGKDHKQQKQRSKPN